MKRDNRLENDRRMVNALREMLGLAPLYPVGDKGLTPNEKTLRRCLVESGLTDGNRRASRHGGA